MVQLVWPLTPGTLGTAHGSGTQLFLEGGGGLAVSPFMGLRLALLVVYKWQSPKAVESEVDKAGRYIIPNHIWSYLPPIDELALRAEVGWRF